MELKNIQLENKLSTTYGLVDGLSLQNLFYTKFESFPSCYMFCNTNAKTKDNYINVLGYLNHMKELHANDEGFQYVVYTTKDVGENKENLGICIVSIKDRIFARVEKTLYETYVLYDNETKNLQSFIDDLFNYYIAPEIESNNFYKIAQNQAGYYLMKAKCKEVKDFSVDKLYNDDFKHEDEKIRNFITTNEKSGLVILHGDVGTGKSTYIKNLITSFPEKKFVIIPPDLMNLLGQTGFSDFVQSLEEHIIILEDCESVIRDRKSTGFNSAVSTLLNMTDGIMGDSLSIKFICTFNENIKDIDRALLRKGRLVSKYEFKKLNADKANVLLEEIYSDSDVIPHTTKPLSLADIFNYDDDSYQNEKTSII